MVDDCLICNPLRQVMTDPLITDIIGKLNAIEAIARDLPAVGKRSELRVKEYEIFVQLEEARLKVIAINDELNKLRYDYPSERFVRVKGVKRG